MEYLIVKSEDWKYYKQSGAVISLLLITSISALVLNQLEKSIGQEQQEAKEKRNLQYLMLTSDIL